MPKFRIRQRRLWIEDFRIADTTENRKVLRVLENWKADRKRPAHFVNAIKLYKALIDGDVELFLDLLIDIAPRTALKLMQRGVSANGQGGSEPVVVSPVKKPFLRAQPSSMEAPAARQVELSGDEQLDVLANSLGLNDVEF